MRVKHQAGASIVQGTVAEQDAILGWIAAANCDVIVSLPTLSAPPSMAANI